MVVIFYSMAIGFFVISIFVNTGYLLGYAGDSGLLIAPAAVCAGWFCYIMGLVAKRWKS